MAVNRYQTSRVYEGNLYTPPVELMGTMLGHLQQRYDQNYAIAQQVKDHFIPSLPQDRAVANEIQQGWQKRIDDVVKSYGGNYAKATKDLNNLLSDVRRDYGPGGKAHAIASNYQSYNDWLGRHRERIAKGDVVAEDLNVANNYYMKNYQGIGEIDPVSGSYNRFSPEDLVNYADAEKIIKDNFSTFKPEKKLQGVSYLKDGMIHYDEVESEGISENRLRPAFQSALAGDPKYMAYLQQKIRFSGIPPEGVQQYVTNLANQRAKSLSYMNYSAKGKMERDPAYIARLKASLDRQNIDYMLASQLQFEPAQPNVTMQKAPDIDPDNWRGNSGFWHNIKYGMALAGGASGDPDMSQTLKDFDTFAPDTMSLDRFMNDPASQSRLIDKNVNPGLAKAMWDKKKKDFQAEFNTKYGKDKEWTDKFERNFWWDYKKEYPSHTSYQTYSFNIPQQAKDQVLGSIIPDLLAGNASFYRPGEYTERQSGESGENIGSDVISTFYNKKDGVKNLNSIGVKYVLPGAGYKAAGYQIDTPQGSFVIVDQDAQRKTWSKMMEGALVPIFAHGKDRGAKGVAGVDPTGQNFIMGTPVRRYEYNAQTGHYDENLYWETDKDTFIQKSLAEYQQEMLPVFRNSLGYGQSKADITPYMYFFGGARN